MKKRNLFLILFLLIFTLQNSFSQGKNKIYNNFVGGMFYHTGFFSMSPSFLYNEKISGYFSGVGGKLAFNITPYFRIGTEGYASKCIYDKKDSFFDIGWGGILFEGGYNFGKIRPFGGLTFGGAGVTQMHVITGDNTDFYSDFIIYRKYSTFVYSAFVGVEYQLTSKILFTLKFDNLSTFGKKFDGQNNGGQRFYFGILFKKS